MSPPRESLSATITTSTATAATGAVKPKSGSGRGGISVLSEEWQRCRASVLASCVGGGEETAYCCGAGCRSCVAVGDGCRVLVMAAVGRVCLDTESVWLVAVLVVVVIAATVIVVRIPIDLLRKRLLTLLLVTSLRAIKRLLMLLLRVLGCLLLAHLVEVHSQRVIGAGIQYRACGISLSGLERRRGRGLGVRRARSVLGAVLATRRGGGVDAVCAAGLGLDRKSVV